MFFHRKPPHHPGCLACHIIVSAFLFLAVIASLIGVVMAHYDPVDGFLVFGTSAASLSIISFAVTVTFFMKQLKGCMSTCDACVMPTVGKKK